MSGYRLRQSDPLPSMPFRMIKTVRPAALAVVAVGAVVCSWGVELMVQASAPVSPPAASVKAPTVSAGLPRDSVVSGSPSKDARGAPPAPAAASQQDDGDGKDDQQPAAEGPALEAPREVIGMLELRKRDLDHREEVVRQAEERLILLKAEVEQILTKNEKLVEASEKRRKEAKEKRDKAASEEKAKADQKALELRNQHQAQLAKIFESMPVEEAAARLEKMPDRKALEVLRLVKGKTAGAILAQIKAERAAKLTELLLVQTH